MVGRFSHSDDGVRLFDWITTSLTRSPLSPTRITASAVAAADDAAADDAAAAAAAAECTNLSEMRRRI